MLYTSIGPTPICQKIPTIYIYIYINPIKYMYYTNNNINTHHFKWISHTDTPFVTD